ncbi:maleylpyruvate isomerase family mycothiol-dependent enzyme [Oryzobacter terrae]|uniref:maleylpyruvate isomerase family mycothiol-dependent enzyme n=1 Tax=Oryzobacter terrae TaxID=1620385 RepID=UPI00366A9BAC
MDPRSPEIPALVDRHTTLLLSTARDLEDVSEPSLCEGWTRAHVLSHVARNADGLVRLVRSVVDGSGETMYASRPARDADIEAGSRRSLDALVADVETSARALAPELDRLGPEHDGHPLERTPGELRGTGADIVLMRLRELTWHHVDLDAGFGFADLEPELVALFVEEEVERLRGVEDAPDVTLRSTEGDEWTVGVGTAQVSGDRAALLGWLARGLTEGVTGDPLPRLPAGR